LDPGHIGLQRQLCTLRDAGIFLAISSKNELTDVEKLFREREDFPLKLDMFSVVVANWTEKSGGIREIAQKLHIGLDAILFVDDNPAELAAVSSAHPQIKTIWAQSATSALSALSGFPGMHRWVADDASDLTRIADVEAVQERDRQMHERSEIDAIAYLASLDIQIKMHWNPVSQIARLYELSNKTNQFNLSLLRVTEAEIENRLRNPDQVAITAAVADRLSDSGLVVALHASLQDGRATIEDLCISCRALGRHIETSIVADALMKIAEKRRITSFIFKFKLGPRNEPAIRWLESFTGQPIDGEEGEVYVNQDMLHLRSTQPRVAAKVIWEE
jgi:FkbH-like protein